MISPVTQNDVSTIVTTIFSPALLTLKNGPYTVQDGGLNPLSAVPTANLVAGSIVAVSDLGGCGSAGSPGTGLAYWNGTGWRRISRGTQQTVAAATLIALDYWKSPMRVSIAGSQSTSTRIVITNAPDGALYSVVKPGISSALAAYSINLATNTAVTDLAVVGPDTRLFEVALGGLSQVAAY